jgi:tRNA G18 (ribose-2'-O)-methylase SpoU
MIVISTTDTNIYDPITQKCPWSQPLYYKCVCKNKEPLFQVFNGTIKLTKFVEEFSIVFTFTPTSKDKLRQLQYIVDLKTNVITSPEYCIYDNKGKIVYFDLQILKQISITEIWLYYDPNKFLNTEQNVLDCYKDKTTEEIQEIYNQNSFPEQIGCLNLTSDQNIGLIVRTASLFCLSGVNIIGRRPYDRRPTVGMHKYIPIKTIKATKGYANDEYDIEIIKEHLLEMSKTHTIIFIEQGGTCLTNVFKNINKPAYFVVGNEGFGIPNEIMEFNPCIKVSIPQFGVGRSHNVGIAASMVLWEYYRDNGKALES